MRGSSVDYDASSEEGVGIPRTVESVTSRIRMEDSAKLYEAYEQDGDQQRESDRNTVKKLRDSGEANSL